MSIIPEGHADLLERPLYCHLATVSAAGRLQANPMWFVWDGETLRFTHTNTRRKYRQLQENPYLAISIVDPDNPARYLEVRATVDSIDDDFTGSLYVELSQRYGRGDGGFQRPVRGPVMMTGLNTDALTAGAAHHGLHETVAV